MRAMVMTAVSKPFEEQELPIPRPGPTQVLLRVKRCGVCRTDLHLVDGELTDPKIPVIPGHEIVGVVEELGDGVRGLILGDRVGVPWLGSSCGTCRWCRSERENLCGSARFTGHTIDGGYAEYTVADARFCFRLPDGFDDDHAAPLLCAGLIGFRSLTMAGDGDRLGIYGFGAAAHIVAQIARHQRRRVYAFVRPGDEPAAEFARSLGATWAGGSDETPPDRLDAAIIFAPVGALVPRALSALDKAGIVVCGGIHMSDIPSFPYEILWGERQIRSVANLTRRDAELFLELAPRAGVKTSVELFPLSRANEALEALREGRLVGAAVLTCER
jgi:alcohol dehydrogenase, propanol-preferring